MGEARRLVALYRGTSMHAVSAARAIDGMRTGRLAGSKAV